MENVPGFASLLDGYYLEQSIKYAKKLGYKSIDYKVINCADYGVPQKRKRFIMFASKEKINLPWPKKKYFESPKSWQNRYRVVGDVITDLSNESSYDSKINHIPSNHSDLVKERYSYIEEGKKMDLDKLPEKLKRAKYSGKPINNYSHVYRRLDRNKPSITLVPGHNAFPIHPFMNRVITVREAARIQTFSDSKIFTGSSQKQNIQVGNAFPPMVATLFGEMIKKAISQQWSTNGLSKLAKYSLVDVS